MSINYTEETSTEKLNNSTSLQIIKEQNNTIIKLLKELSYTIKNNQLEIINDIRHLPSTTLEGETSLQIIEKETEPENTYPCPYKEDSPEHPFELGTIRKKKKS